MERGQGDERSPQEQPSSTGESATTISNESDAWESVLPHGSILVTAAQPLLTANPVSAVATASTPQAPAGDVTRGEDAAPQRNLSVQVDLSVIVPKALSCVRLFFLNAHKLLASDVQNLHTLNA